MEIYLEGITMCRYNLLRESASWGWPRVFFEYRLLSPEAEFRQEKIENYFLRVDPFAAKPQSLGADTAACVRWKLMWPEAYWTTGSQHWFPEGSEVETTLIAPSRGGQRSEALQELSRSLSHLKDGPQIDLWLSGLWVRALPLLPRSLQRGSRSKTLFLYLPVWGAWWRLGLPTRSSLLRFIAAREVLLKCRRLLFRLLKPVTDHTDCVAEQDRRRYRGIQEKGPVLFLYPR